MSLLILNADDVRACLSIAACIDAVDAAMRALDTGDAVLPLRSITPLPDDRGWLGAMPAWLGADVQAHAIKVLSVFPRNHAIDGIDAHQGAVLLFDGERGVPVALLDASALTEVRTAAASAVATRVLARADATTMTLIGTGVQASSHLAGLAHVLPKLERVSVCGRAPERAERFVSAHAATTSAELAVADDAAAAVATSDVVCTATTATAPVLHGAWLRPGTHVVAVGACTPTTRELDADVLRVARLVCDRLESLHHEAGDWIAARDEGVVADAVELGAVLTGRVPGRSSADEITLYESLGVGVQDVAAAHVAVAAARAAGRGTEVAFGG